MQEILPPSPLSEHPKPPLNKRTQFWLQLAAWSWIFVASFQLLRSGGLDSSLIQYVIAYFLLKRASWARIAGLIVSGGVAVTHPLFAWISYHDQKMTELIPALIANSLFYLALFVFLLLPKVKQAFPPPPRKPLPLVTPKEERRIKFWVRVVAVVMIVESLISYRFFEWYRNHGLPPEDSVGAMLGLIAGVGLFCFSQNLGRRFGTFV